MIKSLPHISPLKKNKRLSNCVSHTTHTCCQNTVPRHRRAVDLLTELSPARLKYSTNVVPLQEAWILIEPLRLQGFMKIYTSCRQSSAPLSLHRLRKLQSSGHSYLLHYNDSDASCRTLAEDLMQLTSKPVVHAATNTVNGAGACMRTRVKVEVTISDGAG